MNTSFLGRLGRIVSFTPNLLKSQYPSRLHFQEKVSRFICTRNTILHNKPTDGNSAGTEDSSNFNITHEEFKEHLSTGSNTVIDVRQPEELLNNCFIPGTINIPRKRI